MTLPGMEAGRRVERTEWGIRTRATNADGLMVDDTRRLQIEPRESEADARRVIAARDEDNLPYWRGREPEIVSRVVVTYATRWSA